MSKFTYIDDLDEWKQDFYFSIPIKVRFSETDLFGHMNNVSAFIYFEEARIEFMKYIGVFNLSDDHHHAPIAADLQCDYHQEVFFDDTINLYVKANKIGHRSVDLHYMALNHNDEICFTGRGALVKINVNTKQPTPFTEEERAKLYHQNTEERKSVTACKKKS